MARQYSTGFANAGSVVLTSAALQNAWRDAIVANPAWALVEEISDATYNVVVVKCLASGSGLPADFFVVLWRRKSDGYIFLTFGETYNTSTHAITTPPASSSSASFAIDANGLTTTTNTLTFPSATPSGSAYLVPGSGASIGSAQVWQMIVDSDHFVMSMGNNMRRYVGAFIPFMASDVMPLICMDLDSGAAPPATGMISTVIRLPPGAPSPQAGYSWGVHSVGGGYSQILPYQALSLSVNDHCLGDKPPAWELAVLHDQAKANTVGMVRGRFKKMMQVLTPSGAAIGDNFPTDGNKWYMMQGSASANGIIVDSGVAA